MATAGRRGGAKRRGRVAGRGVLGLGIVSPHAAGIDVGAEEMWVACPPKDGEPNVRTFATDTASLGELADWLKVGGVTAVAMESTGVYWIPLYELLESRGFDVSLVDARTLGRVPGRKTDMIDCQWLQQLHAHGMLRGCFRPKEETVPLRALLRLRRLLANQQDDWVRRAQKALDQMNVRVHRAVTDIQGVTGMRIIRAILAGERNPAALATLRDPHCHKSARQIARELTGNWREEHLYALRLAMANYDHFARQIAELGRHLIEILARVRQRRAAAGLPACPVEEVAKPADRNKATSIMRDGLEELRVALAATFGIDLSTIEGIGVETASAVLGEIGPEVGDFPNEKAFLAYLRLAPNLAISGGKPVRGKPVPRGSPIVKQLLKTAATSLRQSKTVLGAYYRKIAYRKGAGVAAFATARKLASHIYRALANGTPFVTAGLEAEERKALDRQRAHLDRVATRLGLKVVPAN